ncbi:hypothetical protein [Komagataeibacter sp. FXV3]|uniref:hypothetical protein n=1 Tax=Komagataeibacter sp. FXV3 TaxID=2608998 RepID=UPI00187B876D|nr:hypothetical protein [Komagataeibacter sp. FXV3]MBE7729942.1 hypothetical protein [Komagataeibacter sp. FXV3]
MSTTEFMMVYTGNTHGDCLPLNTKSGLASITTIDRCADNILDPVKHSFDREKRLYSTLHSSFAHACHITHA